MAEKEYKDSASRDGYIITLYTDNSSKIERLFIQRDTRKELEKIWRENSNGEPIPPTCSNTQYLGKKILDTFCNGERKGVIGDYEITREPNNSISLIRTYGKGNGMQRLRECAAHFGFEIDPKWNNRQIAPNLIKFIHKLDKADKDAKE